MPDGGIIALIIISVVLLACVSGIISAYETAITSITSYKWKSYVKTHNKQKKLTTKIINHFQKNYSSCLITILVVNNIVAILVANLLYLLLEKTISNEALSTTLNVLTSGFLLSVFCEIVPKTVGRLNVIRTLVWYALVVYLFYLILWPIIKLVNIILNKYEKTPPVSRRDVFFFIDEIENNGIFAKEDAQLIKKTLIFDQVLIGKVMIKWNQVAHCYLTDSPLSVKKQFLEVKFSRLPVIEPQTKKVIGTILFKDFIQEFEKEDGQFSLKEIINPVMIVDKTTPIKEALHKMRLNRAHLTIVQDKNKNILGIACLEDIIEELVGEIYDEHDEMEPVQALDNNVWLVLPNVRAAYFFNKCIKADFVVESKKITVQQYLASLGGDEFSRQNKIETKWFTAEAIVDTDHPDQIIYEIHKKSDVTD